MRDIEDDDAAAAARHNELRDIHHRIDSLKEENERQYNSLAEKLHALELAVARGGRFPAGAWVAAVGILVSVIGSGGILFSKLDSAGQNSSKALTLIEAHLSNASARYQAIQDATIATQDLEKRVPVVEERVKSLESRIVGQGPNGWHRSDHEQYAKMMDERCATVIRRIEILEQRQDALCTRVKMCSGGNK